MIRPMLFGGLAAAPQEEVPMTQKQQYGRILVSVSGAFFALFGIINMFIHQLPPALFTMLGYTDTAMPASTQELILIVIHLIGALFVCAGLLIMGMCSGVVRPEDRAARRFLFAALLVIGVAPLIVAFPFFGAAPQSILPLIVACLGMTGVMLCIPDRTLPLE